MCTIPRMADLEAPALPSRPPLRGSPQRLTDFMEQLQLSYLRAVAAAAGCIVGRPEIDDGVDVTLTHSAPGHLHDHSARLEVQLKATTALRGRSGEVQAVTARMRRDRWEYYHTPNTTIHKIVVIMTMPRDQAHWTFARHKALSIHHCAYWVNLAKEPESTAANPLVSAPTTQVFDDIALCDMMERIGQGGSP